MLLAQATCWFSCACMLLHVVSSSSMQMSICMISLAFVVVSSCERLQHHPWPLVHARTRLVVSRSVASLHPAASSSLGLAMLDFVFGGPTSLRVWCGSGLSAVTSWL